MKNSWSGVKQNNPNPIFSQKTNELNSFDDVVWRRSPKSKYNKQHQLNNEGKMIEKKQKPGFVTKLTRRVPLVE